MASIRHSLELIFLGTGPAMGLDGRWTSVYALQLGQRLILIDCGPAIIQQLQAVGMPPHAITDLCFTHAHADHALGFPMLMLWRLFKAPAGIGLPRVIASEAVLAALDAIVRQTLGGEAPAVQAGPRVALPAESPATVALYDDIILRTWPMQHSPCAPVLGLRYEIRDKVISFTGDTGPCENIVALGRNADLLVHEATFSATLDPGLAEGAHGHSTARIAGRHAAAAGARRLALVHMDVTQAGQESVYLAEAAEEFQGPVSAPMGGAIYSLE